MAGDHHHGSGTARAGERHRGRLLAAFLITLGFFVVQAVAGLLTNSLALLADAGHMLTDVVGIGMALAAITLASRFAQRTGSRSTHTFGLYRLEILAALLNALLLFGWPCGWWWRLCGGWGASRRCSRVRCWRWRCSGWR
jgi:cobalt-zinc-cadmium efflux system protein